jgi:hypothetical protein
MTFADPDIFHEMVWIREALRLGYLPRVDIFSYVPTINPVIHHEWGAGVILYVITVQLGLGAYGLMALKYLLSAFVAVGCFVFATRRGASLSVFSFLAPIGIGLGWGGFSTIRAQLFTLCFLTVLLFLLEEDRKGRRWALWSWLPVYLLWLNVHGGFIVGLGLFAVYIIEKGFNAWLAEKEVGKALKTLPRPSLFLLATACLTLVNPDGVYYLGFIWNTLDLNLARFIPEWEPLWRVSWLDLSAFLIALSVVCYCLTQKKLPQMPGLFLLAAIAWTAFWHYRHLTIFAVAWMCYVPVWVEQTRLGEAMQKAWRERSPWLTLIFLILGAGGMFYAGQNHFWQLRIPTTAIEEQEGVPVYPVGAVNFLKEQGFSGNIFVNYSAGAYVSWNLFPNARVSMDSRFHMAYTPALVTENIKFYQGQKGWQATLLKYQTDAVLVPRWTNLENILAQSLADHNNPIAAKWKLVYVDDGYSLYWRSALASNTPVRDRRGKLITGRFP